MSPVLPAGLRRLGPLSRAGLSAALVLLASCRIESAVPAEASAAATQEGGPSGDVWVYTSMYQHVLDALEPLLKEKRRTRRARACG